MKKIKAFIEENKRTVFAATAGAILGAVGGFFYWKFVGCLSGTCPIWSNPYRAMLYGALMGSLLLMTFVPETKKIK